FFFNDTATTEIYTLSLHDALPISVNYANQCELNVQEAAQIARRAEKKKNAARGMAERRKRKLARSESI
ncbi:hypothetical protein SHD_0280, partial [Shewanella decolorationis S12]